MTEIQVVAPSDLWRSIRVDPKFVELMRIARVANSLSLGYAALATDGSDDSPTARRERFGSLFYTAALLKEGLDTAQTVGRWCRNMPQYQMGLGRLLSDPTVTRFRNGVLGRVRDQLVFHFDRDATANGLGRLPDDEMVIATYPLDSPTFRDTYFDAADDAVLGCLFGDTAEDDVYTHRLAEFIAGVADLLRRFVPAAHELVVAGLLDLGCRRQQVDRAPHPLDAA